MKIVTDVPVRDVLEDSPEATSGFYNDVNIANKWMFLDIVMATEFPNGCTREEALEFIRTREDYVRERLGIVERTFDPDGTKAQAASLVGRMSQAFG